LLFVVSHCHTPELCPSDSPEKIKRTIHIVASEAHAKSTGVKVLGSYIAAPEHTLFFIIESDTYEKIIDFFRPMMKIGTPRIVPVSQLKPTVEKFK
jgi:hypothetical protein